MAESGLEIGRACGIGALAVKPGRVELLSVQVVDRPRTALVRELGDEVLHDGITEELSTALTTLSISEYQARCRP